MMSHIFLTTNYECHFYHKTFLLPGSYGLIEFSLSYDEPEEHLVVNVIKAKVLPVHLIHTLV